MINWKHPKRGEVPAVTQAIVWVHGRDMYSTAYLSGRQLEIIKAVNCAWMYAKEFPWPEDLEDEKSNSHEGKGQS